LIRDQVRAAAMRRGCEQLPSTASMVRADPDDTTVKYPPAMAARAGPLCLGAPTLLQTPTPAPIATHYWQYLGADSHRRIPAPDPRR
jgi:hypothetical protein